MPRKFKYCYGPVPSRRMGRSLGIDLLPFKTCSYDCMYCQLGHTTNHTIDLKEYVPAKDVLEELTAKLKEEPAPDIISFAGSGEPTLHSRLGDIIMGIKKMTDIPVAVFTNASLFWKPEVRASLALADIVSPSLDAASPKTAERINRLAKGLSYERIFQGLVDFCREYRGRIWLEVLLAEGVNDTEHDIEMLARAIGSLEHIERVQLNSVSRPPAEKEARAMGADALRAIAARLPGNVEIIASYARGTAADPVKTVSAEEVADLVDRHPSTVDGIASSLGITRDLARTLVGELLTKGAIQAEEQADGTYYCMRQEG